MVVEIVTLTQQEIRDLSVAISNYETLWEEWCQTNGKQSSHDAVYIDANIRNVKMLLKELKDNTYNETFDL